MFDSTKDDLKDILEKADSGKLQLPDFQRDYVWTDEDVKSLIASIASCPAAPFSCLAARAYSAASCGRPASSLVPGRDLPW